MMKEVVWYKSRKPSHAEKATSWKERGQGTMTRVGFEENEQKSNGYGTMKWIVSVMDNKI